MDPLVSVVIAVYNGEKYIRETLDSLILQTLINWECWIVDDGSADSTVNIVKEYCAKDARFNLMETKGSNGPYFAANLAFPLCKGEMIARVDADDICQPNRFDVQTKYLINHLNVNVCSSQCYTMNGVGSLGLYTEIPSDLNLLRWQLLFHNRLVHSSMMVRRKWFKHVGYYPNKDLCQDYLIWCKAIVARSIGLCSERLIVWRQHKDSITSSKKDSQFKSTYKVGYNYANEILGEVDADFYKNLMADAWGYKLDDSKKLDETLKYFITLYNLYYKNFGTDAHIQDDFRRRYFLLLRRNIIGKRLEGLKALVDYLKFDPSAIFSRDVNSTIFRLIFK
jgi:glycosyltransferase involved in cell wall biosynthesis